MGERFKSLSAVMFNKAQAIAGSEKCLFSACFTRSEERRLGENGV